VPDARTTEAAPPTTFTRIAEAPSLRIEVPVESHTSIAAKVVASVTVWFAGTVDV